MDCLGLHVAGARCVTGGERVVIGITALRVPEPLQ